MTAKGAVFVPFTLQHHGEWSIVGVPCVLLRVVVCGSAKRSVCALIYGQTRPGFRSRQARAAALEDAPSTQAAR